MRIQLTAMLMLAASALAGCGGARGEDRLAPAPGAVQSLAPVSVAANTPPVAVAPAVKRSVTRTIDKDPDGDGIADYRVIITETFDGTGAPVSRTREEDFDADGIIDARTVTAFATGG